MFTVFILWHHCVYTIIHCSLFLPNALTPYPKCIKRLPTTVQLHIIPLLVTTMHSLFINCLQIMHSQFTVTNHMFTVYTQCVHCLHTMCSLYTRHAFTVYTPCVHCLHTMHSLFTHHVLTVYTPCGHCLHTMCSLFTRHVVSVHTPAIHCFTHRPFSVYIPCVHCLHTTCSLF